MHKFRETCLLLGWTIFLSDYCLAVMCNNAKIIMHYRQEGLASITIPPTSIYNVVGYCNRQGGIIFEVIFLRTNHANTYVMYRLWKRIVNDGDSCFVAENLFYPSVLL